MPSYVYLNQQSGEKALVPFPTGTVYFLIATLITRALKPSHSLFSGMPCAAGLSYSSWSIKLTTSFHNNRQTLTFCFEGTNLNALKQEAHLNNV
jgi:hypothetical protein